MRAYRHTVPVQTVAVLSAAAFAAALFCPGCETQPADQQVYIDPSSAVLQRGQSVVLTAYGGFEYTWRLEHETWGILSARIGSTTTYTSLYDPAVPAASTNAAGQSAYQQIVYVDSAISGVAPDGGTNSPGYKITAQCTILHIATPSN